MNTSNNNLKEFLLEKYEMIKAYVMKYIRIVIPVAVAVLALIVFIAAMVANSHKKQREAAEELALAQESEEQQSNSGVVSIPDIPLEEGTHADVNEFVQEYYSALSSGDIDTVKTMNNNIDDTEAIRITETAKYIDSYDDIDVFTKTGPAEGTYIAYVYSTVKFTDYDKNVPGMQAYYICTDDSGNLYVNDGEESESVTNYIREVSLQDDVVDLNNRAAVAYNDMLAENEDLSVFLVDLTETIDTSVGESLAEAEAPVTEEEEEEAEPEEEAATATAETVTTVRPTTTVNVRSSDSETADKLGKASAGEEFKLIETKGNGWSEIEYNGKSAFIKTEFLETASTETIVTVPEKETDSTSATASTDTGKTTTSGTVTVKENVRVRASASENGEKIATVYVGQKLDFVEKMSNGWTKIKYNGNIAYVKSEYVE